MHKKTEECKTGRAQRVDELNICLSHQDASACSGHLPYRKAAKPGAVQMGLGRSHYSQWRRWASFFNGPLPDTRAATGNGTQPVFGKYQFPNLDYRARPGNESGSLEEGFRFLAGGSGHTNTFW